jgi:hypothetical protein
MAEHEIHDLNVVGSNPTIANFCDRLPRCNITEGASPLHKIFASPMALPKYFVP